MTFSHRQMFQDTLKNDVNITLPFMHDCTDQLLPSTGIEIGKEFDIYVSEVHHQTMIKNLLDQYSATNEIHMNGALILPQRPPHENRRSETTFHSPPSCPTFVYLNELGDESPLDKVGKIAPKVEVQECLIYPDNSAHIQLRPISFVRVQAVWQREGSENMIHDAKVSHFGKQEMETIIGTKKSSWSLGSFIKAIILAIFSTMMKYIQRVGLVRINSGRNLSG